MATPAIAANSSLTRKSWGDTALKASMQKSILYNLMRPGKAGMNMKSPIVVEDFVAGDGDSKSYPFLAQKASSPIFGDNRVQGTGSANVYASDTITLNRIREALVENNTTMSEMRTRVDLEKDISEMLGDMAARGSEIGLTNALVDTTQGRTVNRYQYGSAANNAKYNSGSHATSMANINATDDKASLAMIDKIMTKINTKSSGVGFMNPAEIITTSDRVARAYVGLFHPYAALDIRQDPDFKNQVFVGQNDMFNVIEGYNYIGKYRGLEMWEYAPIDGQNDILLNVGAGAAGINVAHNLILGAGAALYGRGKVARPKGNTKFSMSANGSMMVTTVDDDHGGDAEWAYTKVEGYKKLVDYSNPALANGEDFATFHWFTSATSGL